MTSGDKVVPGFILPVARPSPVSWLSRECVARQAEPRQIVPPKLGYWESVTSVPKPKALLFWIKYLANLSSFLGC